MRTFLNVVGILALFGAIVITVFSKSAVHEIEAAIAILVACTAFGFSKTIEHLSENGKLLSQIRDSRAVQASAIPEMQPSSEHRIIVPPVPGTESYFIALEGKAAGPHTMKSVYGLLERGKIAPDTLLFKEGANEWKALRDVLPVDRRDRGAG